MNWRRQPATQYSTRRWRLQLLHRVGSFPARHRWRPPRNRAIRLC